MDYAATDLCKEIESGGLFPGRMCWGTAAMACNRCGKGICLVHTRRRANVTLCASCHEDNQRRKK
jgi:hypothetical protein